MSKEQWYKKSVEETLKSLDVDRSTGLTKDEVEKRTGTYGLNELQAKKGKTLWSMLFSQFKDFMVIVLIIAAGISGFLGEIKDTAIILFIVVLNAVIGVVQENKAEKSLEALKNMSKPIAKVLRNGKKMETKSSKIVPGDIVILEAGDFIPADGRLIESADLKIEESALTGESMPIEKNTQPIEGEDPALGDRKNMVFSSSMVTYGRGVAVITDTGMDTEIGHIAKMIQEQDDLKTPLQEKLEELGKFLGIIALAICVVIFFIGYFQGRPPFEMFMLAVSLAVAAIPEGLPAIVTIVLSLGVQRMIKKHAIIRKLPAVETLGTASVICSDKTGTLTQNKMTVTKLYTYNKLMGVEDVNIEEHDKEMAVRIALLCNDGTIEEEDGKKKALGDPTETALLVLGRSKGMFKKEVENDFERIKEIPFDSDRKMMTTIHSVDSGYRSMTKGAPDVLLERCSKILVGEQVKPLTAEMKQEISQENMNMAEKALRVLALAYKDLNDLPNSVTSESVENDLVFVGLTGMIDPPREEVKQSVKECREAGIKPVMITGDYKLTAIAIAKELGILEHEDEAIDGKALSQMDEQTLAENVEKYAVYARVSPEHKVKIVNAWQSKGKIVAMTGDGVNDAPALKGANIGCAMGITGTDVSKEASDMILTDDNFSTIVAAVEEGRVIFQNIRKSIHYLLSSNVGEVLTLFFALIFRMENPLLPIHVLWINLVTDTLPALALGVDPAELDIMERQPRDPKKSIFADGLGTIIIIKGIMISIVTLLAFNIGNRTDLATGRTMAFATLCLSQLINSYGVRSTTLSVFKIGLFSNKYLVGATATSALLMLIVVFLPFLRTIFELNLLTITQWGSLLGLAIIPMLTIELYKTVRGR